MRIALALGAGLLLACGGDDTAATDAGSDAGAEAATVDVAVEPPAPVQVLLSRTGIDSSQLGVLVNDDDALSVAVAAYYVAARKIPTANVVHLHLSAGDAGSPGASLTPAAFAPLAAEVASALGSDVQALAITWTRPYAVGNMSITSAFALGFHAIVDTCNDPNAQAGTPNPYAKNMASTTPYTDVGFRPAMMIPATTIEEAKAIIDKGVASDDTWPTGSAYLMNTSDQTRSARCIVNTTYGWTNECQTFLDTWDPVLSGVGASIVSADDVTNKTDVLFYVEGLASVPGITTNTYLPGAMADHLTSFGGQVPTSGQMSAFNWLKAGATGSFGTVVEPCAFTQKFPDPSISIPQYFGGATLVEAYWKSVKWPAEGLFIGEPLARPFGTGFHWQVDGGALTIETTTMIPKHTYAIDAADSAAGPFDVVLGDLTVPKYQKATFTIPSASRAVYRFRATP